MCLNVVKNMLTKIIYPFLESGSELQGKDSISILCAQNPNTLY